MSDEQPMGEILDLFLPFIDRGPDGYRDAQERIDERLRKAPVLEQMLAGRAVQDDGLPPGLDVEKLHAEIHDPEWQAQDGCHDAVERLLAALSELHQHARTQPHGPDCDRDNCYVMAAPPLHDPQEPERG